MVKSGVDPKVYKAYAFEDHIWSQIGPQQSSDMLELAHRCVKVSGEYWMKMPDTGRWHSFSNITDAKKQAFNTWTNGRLASGTQVDGDLINQFFDGERFEAVVNGKNVTRNKLAGLGSCPNLTGRIVIPYGPTFITYDRSHYLNESAIRVNEGAEEDIGFGKLILYLLHGALTNSASPSREGVQEKADAVYASVLRGEWSSIEFRFLVNWLAALVQEPGINLQTNVWLVGQLQGIGKSTLVRIMRAMFGGVGVCELNQAEIEAGWNDHLLGSVLVEVNESDTRNSSKSGQWWNQWIKKTTCEDNINIRKRNTGAWDVINISNYIFTTNDEAPIYLDQSDRRNFFIKTTDDYGWRSYATMLHTCYINSGLMMRLVSGFAFILQQIAVDKSLVNTAPTNQAKVDIQLASIDPVEEWVRYDAGIQREQEVGAQDLYMQFQRWFTIAHPGERPPSQTVWGRSMAQLVAQKIIEKKRGRSGQLYRIPNVLPAKLEFQDDVETIQSMASAAKSLAPYENEATFVTCEIETDEGIDFSKLSEAEKLRRRLALQDRKMSNEERHIEERVALADVED